MMLRRRKQQGQSVIEFTTVILFILLAFLVFQKYIVRGLSGKWHEVGDSLGQGRIYDPKETVECEFAAFFEDNEPKWFDRACFEERCRGDCLLTTKKAGPCDACLAGCRSPYCDD